MEMINLISINVYNKYCILRRHRLLMGLASLLDGIIALSTFGTVTSHLNLRCSLYAYKKLNMKEIQRIENIK